MFVDRLIKVKLRASNFVIISTLWSKYVRKNEIIVVYVKTCIYDEI